MERNSKPHKLTPEEIELFFSSNRNKQITQTQKQSRNENQLETLLNKYARRLNS